MKPKTLDELIEMIESCIGSGELLNISDQDLIQIRDILRLYRILDSERER